MLARDKRGDEGRGMSGVIRTVPCGCESGQPCTPATRCAITTAVHIQREDDEAEMERLREDHEAELAALRADAEIGQRWNRDSSLETWFPYTAEELTRLRAELVAAREDAERYRVARAKVWCIVGDAFHVINLRPTYVAPDAAIEFDAAIDAAIDAARAGGE